MKEYRKKILILIAYAVVGFLVGVFLSEVLDLESIGPAIGFLSIAFFITLLLLLPFPKPVFDSWKKFARVYLPIALVIIALTPEYGDGGLVGVGGGIPLPFFGEREATTWFLSVLYVIISVILMLVKWRKSRTEKPS